MPLRLSTPLVTLVRFFTTYTIVSVSKPTAAVILHLMLPSTDQGWFVLNGKNRTHYLLILVVRPKPSLLSFSQFASDKRVLYTPVSIRNFISPVPFLTKWSNVFNCSSVILPFSVMSAALMTSCTLPMQSVLLVYSDSCFTNNNKSIRLLNG